VEERKLVKAQKENIPPVDQHYLLATLKVKKEKKVVKE
jgi:hypothetical protein